MSVTICTFEYLGISTCKSLCWPVVENSSTFGDKITSSVGNASYIESESNEVSSDIQSNVSSMGSPVILNSIECGKGKRERERK